MSQNTTRNEKKCNNHKYDLEQFFFRTLMGVTIPQLWTTLVLNRFSRHVPGGRTEGPGRMETDYGLTDRPCKKAARDIIRKKRCKSKSFNLGNPNHNATSKSISCVSGGLLLPGKSGNCLYHYYFTHKAKNHNLVEPVPAVYYNNYYYY
eukprot:scaffold6312_cov85-Cylindrotheca_fusiformis.AAC.1